jgi:sensor histidine kinase
MTSHFAENAFYIDAKVALLKRDQSIIYGSAHEAITDENLRLAYGADIRVVKNEIEGRSVYSCVPII